jgi:hypothetical protein
VWVLVRGGTFRANRSDLQSAIGASIRRHVLKPLRMEYPTAQLHVHLCVREHRVAEYNNSWFLQELTKFPAVTGSLREHDSLQTKIQADMWFECVSRVPSAVSFALILRADLFFVKPVNVSALHTSRFFFQWNLWHDCATHEMADQKADACCRGYAAPASWTTTPSTHAGGRRCTTSTTILRWCSGKRSWGTSTFILTSCATERCPARPRPAAHSAVTRRGAAAAASTT